MCGFCFSNSNLVCYLKKTNPFKSLIVLEKKLTPLNSNSNNFQTHLILCTPVFNSIEISFLPSLNLLRRNFKNVLFPGLGRLQPTECSLSDHGSSSTFGNEFAEREFPLSHHTRNRRTNDKRRSPEHVRMF